MFVLPAGRARRGEFFDSAYEASSEKLPVARPSRSPDPDDSVSLPSLASLRLDEDVVAVDVRLPEVASQVQRLVESRGWVVGGAAAVPIAAAILVDAGADVAGRLAEIRKRSRPDAALLVLPSPDCDFEVATAYRAGARACLRAPLVAEELFEQLAGALDARAAKVQAADLARQLDLEAHLTSVGRVTAGISHEIANPLGAAVANLHFVREGIQGVLADQHLTLDQHPGLRDALADTERAHDRLRGLLRAVRSLVRKEESARLGPVDVFATLVGVRGWLVDELRGVDVEILGEPRLALADRNMLGQLLQNLVANAAHAARTLSSPRVRLHAYAANDRVVASVRDNGPGIPPDVQDKVFEPFFTTRRTQGGTGLGLALCLEYARQMGAELSFWSVPGRGTCFRVSLRAVGSG